MQQLSLSEPTHVPRHPCCKCHPAHPTHHHDDYYHQGDHPVEPCWWESGPHGGALVPQDIFLLQRFKSCHKRQGLTILILQFLKRFSLPGSVARSQNSWKDWRWTRWNPNQSHTWFGELSDNKDIPGCRHLHDDPKEILGGPDDPKTKELPLHLLVQPTLHWWILQCHWKRWHSGNWGLFIR